ncbi:MAG: Abi family protein [Cellvibrionaceae bacterium]|nr:Abi family protein [Cellvibrionaceae bacterium]
MKNFNKPPLPVKDQLELLRQRGLDISDDERSIRFLEVVTLFRLCPYMRPFEIGGGDHHRFKEGAKLSDIVSTYRFDGALRQMIMDAIERVEVAVRACISNHMCCTYKDAHWYLDPKYFHKFYRHADLLENIRDKQTKELASFHREQQRIEKSRASEEQKRSRIDSRKRDSYSRFYAATYDIPELPPSWAIFEDLTLGAVSKLFQGLARDNDRKIIAHQLGIPGEILVSWLHTLTFVRNICAHHGRLWNRELSVPPKLPNSWKPPKDGKSLPSPIRRIYIVATILAHLMMEINPASEWRERFSRLMINRNNATLSAMGFPKNWQVQPQWQNLKD